MKTVGYIGVGVVVNLAIVSCLSDSLFFNICNILNLMIGGK